MSALVGILFPLKALWARRKAETDPVDPVALAKVDFRSVDGH